MKHRFALVLALFAVLFSGFAQQNQPLRVFIRGGARTHESGAPGHARFLEDWKKLLKERGAVAEGASTFPTRAQLAKTDVLVLHGAEGGSISRRDRWNLEAFLQRGGGMVVIHDALGETNAPWLKGVVGGAWEHGQSRWQAGLTGLYFQDYRHPITEGVSNFDLDDESCHGLQMMPGAKVLATTFQTAKEIVPQMWVYEKEDYRAFVSAPGHKQASFNLPHFRSLILRGIAWAGKRHVDLLTSADERSHLRYPEGGPTAPEEAVKKIQVQPDFDINLVAAEPLIVKPISVDWDPRGRMWVAVTPEYPFKVDKAPAKDSILILEDTDGDGRMDKRQVFYEGLTLVTSFVFHRDGVIVAQAPQILWLRDTDGDGVADKKEVLFEGFGTHDTHAVISNFRWGMDGWIYGAQGYSGNGSTNVIGKANQAFGKVGNGLFRFKPDGSAIEVVTSFSGNTWGLDFSWDGELFFSKANGPHISHVGMSEKYLGRGKLASATSDKAIEDHQKVFPIFGDQRHEYVQVAPVGVFTAASGSMIYDGGAWPERYHGSYFVSEPTVHIVHEDIIIRAESYNYEATKRQEGEFIAGTDLWFRPVQTRYGPDGAMYILDFYNQAVSHNDIRGIEHGPGNAAVRPDRDHKHGRIWRVQHKQARRFDLPALDKATVGDLVKAFEHPNGWVRTTAQRLLVERGGNVVAPSLSEVVKSNRFSYARVHALWSLHQLGALTESNLIAGITDLHPAVQKNALRIIADTDVPLTAPLEKAILRNFKDADERVRLSALLSLSHGSPSKEANQAVLKLFPDLKDPWSRSAVAGIARLAPMEFIKGAFASDKSDACRELVGPLVENLAYNRQADLTAEVIQVAAKQAAATDKLKVAVLEALNKQWRLDFVFAEPDKLEGALKKLLTSENRAVRVAVLPLAASFGTSGGLADEAEKVKKLMLADVESPKLKDEDRAPLLSSLMAIKSLQPEVIAVMDKMLAASPGSTVQKQLIAELGKTANPAAGDSLIRNYGHLKEDLKPLAFGTIVKRSEWTLALVDALAKGSIRPNDLGSQGVSRLLNHSDKNIAGKAKAAIEAIHGPQMREKDALIARFKAYLTKPADLKNGQAMFRQNCLICHKFQGEGKDLGPDLTGAGFLDPSVLLVHILDPNRVVEGNFVPFNLTTKKQEDYFGLVVRENQESVVLRNLEGDVEIRRADVASLKSSGLSLMPEGLETLGERTVRDIILYLRENVSKHFRALDLTAAFTADSRKGLYAEQSEQPSLALTKSGLVLVENIPFNIANPTNSVGGRNVVVLKGGSGFAKTLPQRVEIVVGTKAVKIHVLGGVAGWGFPYGELDGHHVNAAKAQLRYADGATEDIVLKNGEEFADFVRQIEVPGSKYVPGLVGSGQLRWFTIAPKRNAIIKKIVLESFDNHLAPTIVAMTAQVAE